MKEGGFQGLWNKALSLFNKGRDEVVRSSKVGKTRLDLSSLKNEKERAFERLGEEVYRRYRENRFSLPGFDSFFTEIDIINLKLSSKERELRGFKGEEAGSARADAFGGHEGKERPLKEKRKGPSYAQEGKQERPESGRRPKRKYYRPKRKPSESGHGSEVKMEHGSNRGL